MSKSVQKTFDDVRNAFESGAVLESSRAELEQLLVALSRETIADPAMRGRAAEMGETIRQLLLVKNSEAAGRRPSLLVCAALVLSLLALLCSGPQAYRDWIAARTAQATTDTAPNESSEVTLSANRGEATADQRAQLSLFELARRAPSIRRGTLQAWWAGEQARQVQRLESQARRQSLAGDLQGASDTLSQADAIRRTIASLDETEKFEGASADVVRAGGDARKRPQH